MAQDGAAPPMPVKLTLKVKDHISGDIHLFKVKMTTRIGKVVDGYCKEVNVEKANIRFLFEGRRLGDQDTPQSVGLEDGDQIDCFYEATGGCS